MLTIEFFDIITLIRFKMIVLLFLVECTCEDLRSNSSDPDFFLCTTVSITRQHKSRLIGYKMSQNPILRRAFDRSFIMDGRIENRCFHLSFCFSVSISRRIQNGHASDRARHSLHRSGHLLPQEEPFHQHGGQRRVQLAGSRSEIL